ncbi:WD repeat-containing protein 6 [Allomyces arbusculus]|nr:WD repeat-containing protein 6 [Allomyces arbusculus]
MILPLSDPSLGPSMIAIRNVTQLAIPAMNALDPANYAFQFVSYDSQRSRSGAITAMVQAVSRDNAVGILGEYSSLISIPLALAGNPHQLWQCASATSSEMSIKAEFPRYFRTIPDDPQQGLRMAYLARAMGWTSVNLLVGTDFYGQSIGYNFQQSATALGISVEMSLTFNPGTTDVTAAVAAIKASASNVVVFAAFAADGVTIFREARRLGILGPQYAWVGSESMSLYLSSLDPRNPNYATDVANVQGLLYLFPRQASATNEFAALQARYAATYGGNTDVASISYGTIFYDCALAMAHGLIQVANRYSPSAVLAHTSNASLTDFITTFDGASGRVVLDAAGNRIGDFDVYNVYNGVATVAFSVAASGAVTTVATPHFYSGSTSPPPDRPPKSIAYPNYGDAGVIVLAALRALLLAAILATMVYLSTMRHLAAVKNLSWPFLVTIATGCVVMLVSEFLGIGVPVGAWGCHASGWVLAVGFDLVMASAGVKTYRIYSIFANKRLAALKGVNNANLMRIVTATVLTQCLIFAIWVGVFPLAPQLSANKSYIMYECKAVTSAGATAYPILLGVSLGYNGLLLLAVAFFGYKTRNVMSAFRETVWIAYTTQNIVLAALVAIPFSLIQLPEWGLGTYYLRSAVLLYAIAFTFYALVGRIAWTLLHSGVMHQHATPAPPTGRAVSTTQLGELHAAAAAAAGGVGTTSTTRAADAMKVSLHHDSGRVAHVHGVYAVKSTSAPWYALPAWERRAVHLYAADGMLVIVPDAVHASGIVLKLKCVQFDPDPPAAPAPLCVELFHTGAKGGSWMVQMGSQQEHDAWVKVLGSVCLRSTASKSRSTGGKTSGGTGSGGLKSTVEGEPGGSDMRVMHRAASAMPALGTGAGGGGGGGMRPQIGGKRTGRLCLANDKLDHKSPAVFAHFINSDVVAVATGVDVNFYSVTTGRQVGAATRLVDHTRCHGIDVPVPIEAGGASGIMAVFGAKQAVMLSVTTTGHGENLVITARVLSRWKCRDWIKALRVLPASGHVVLVTAHNWVEIYPSIDARRPDATLQCSERCILYSATIVGDSLDSLVIASGTVFNQVLLWRPNGPQDADGAVQVDKALVGHEGVIFHVAFSTDGRHVSSVSDDRSIRIWDTATGTQVRALFGHTARVWMSVLLDKMVVSVSEDCTCRVWTWGAGDGDESGDECVAVWDGHVGKNVWCVAVDPERRTVVTGGNDGGIRVWDLARLSSRRIEYEDQLLKITLPDASDTIRNVVTTSTNLLVSTKLGHFYALDPSTSSWTHLAHDTRLTSYATLATTSTGLLLAGNLTGQILALSPTIAHAPVEHAVHTTKIMGVRVLGDHIFTWDQSAAFYVSRMDGTAWTVLGSFAFDGKDQVQAIAVHAELVFVSTRMGSLLVYPFPADATVRVDPIVAFPKAHGKLNGTSIVVLPSDSTSIRLATTGRDGCLAFWILDVADQTAPVAAFSRDQENDNGDRELIATHEQQYLQLQQRVIGGPKVPKHVDHQRETLKKRFLAERARVTGVFGGRSYTLARTHQERLTRGWLERLILVNGQLLVVEFHHQRMILRHHAQQARLLSVACGGAHRFWDLTAADPAAAQCTFAFIRREALFVYRSSTATADATAATSPRVSVTLADSLHGREIRSLVYLSPDRLLTGSEDTTMAVVVLPEYRLVTRMHKHRSVVKCLARAAGYVFSAGGGEELVAWRIDGGGLVEVAKCPPMSAVLEVRIMDVATVEVGDVVVLVLAGSDGVVRVVVYEPQCARFYLVAEGEVGRCVLAVAAVQGADGILHVVAGATNGRLYSWRVDDVIAKYLAWFGAQAPGSLRRAQLQARVVHLDSGAEIQVHQSGINSLAVMVGQKGSMALALTGGDDGGVAVTRITLFREPAPSPPQTVWHTPCAHSGTVTAVHWLESATAFVTTSTDHRVNLWRARDDDKWEMANACHVDVADVSCMAVHGRQLVVAGVGLQRLELRDWEAWDLRLGIYKYIQGLKRGAGRQFNDRW